MYNAIDLSLFEIYISLEMRINKYIFAFISPNVLHMVRMCTSCGRFMFHPFYSSDTFKSSHSYSSSDFICTFYRKQTHSTELCVCFR